MKRLGSTESLGGFISVCPSTDGKRSGGGETANGLIYSRGYQSMLDGLDEEDCIEECGGHVSEKKRRLSVDQVKALEKNFEVENKLEPERKLKLAQELGLQPRQVAVWFQNRRARWKTKQLERDYGVLKAKFDALKLNFDSLQRDKDALLSEVSELKSQLGEESIESKDSIKEEMLITSSENNVFEQGKVCSESKSNNNNNNSHRSNNSINGGVGAIYGDLKDGSSDSDSSAILNDDHQHQFIGLKTSSSPSSSINCFKFSDSNEISGNAHAQKNYHYHQHQYVKMEEQNFLGTEESCNFFSEDQAPTLHWYCPDQWN
ncbi:hypothetical protein Sjap_010607 [Stephania japonica]|uniref:Homeobox-leucine zipper protein n=1 Tax=Stephania japonica TaxID=461633 RepID=A0AAP0P6K9_9MAGN